MLTDGLPRRSFGMRYLALLSGEVGSKLCVLLAFAYLARVLGPHDFGAIEFALSVAIFFVLAAECGLGSYGARAIEAEPQQAAQLVPRVGLVRAAIASSGYLVLLALSTQSGAAAGVLAVYGLLVLLTPFNTQWVFQGLRQMPWVALGNLLRYSLFAVLVLVLVRRGSDPRLVGLAEVAGAAGLAVFNTILLRQVLKVRFQWQGVWRGAVDLFRRGWFLGASDLAWALMWYSPVIIVGWITLARSPDVAWLGASLRIVMALHAFVWLYFFNMLPNLTRELTRGTEEWRRLIHRSLALSTWAACVVALAGTLLAPVVMRTVFGQAFGEAALTFQIAIWMIPVAWLSGHFRFSLIAAGRQDREFRCSALAGFTTVLLAVPGTWLYGAAGAAAALLIAGVVNAVAAAIAASRAIGPVRLSAAAPALSACLGSLVIWIVLGPMVGGAAAAAAAGLVFAAGAATRAPLHQLRSSWAERTS